MAKLASKSSTVTWISLWDALVPLTEHYPRVLAERMLVRKIAARHVRRKHFPANGHDLRIWRKLGGVSADPHVLFPVIHWEESTLEAHWRGQHRAYRIKVVREDVLQLLPENAMPEEQPEAQEEPAAAVRHMTAKKWITAEARRLKRNNLIPANIVSKMAFATLLAANMALADEWDYSISFSKVVHAPYIKNKLEDWGLWPLDRIPIQ